MTDRTPTRPTDSRPPTVSAYRRRQHDAARAMYGDGRMPRDSAPRPADLRPADQPNSTPLYDGEGLTQHANLYGVGSSTPRSEPQPCYRWEPVSGDCTRHHGPHEGFRCNGAIGRLIEVIHAEAAPPQHAPPPLDVDVLAQVLREHRPDNRGSHRDCTCYEWRWNGNEKQYERGWAAHIAAEYNARLASTEPDHGGVITDQWPCR